MIIKLNCYFKPLILSNLLCVIDLLWFRQVKRRTKDKDKSNIQKDKYVIPQVLKKMRKAINFVLNIPIKYPLTGSFIPVGGVKCLTIKKLC